MKRILFRAFALLMLIACILTTGCVKELVIADSGNETKETENNTSAAQSEPAQSESETVPTTAPKPDDEVTTEQQPEEPVEIPVIASTNVMIDVPYISQEDILPNGCEAASVAMVLQYFGFDIDAVDFAREYLKTEHFFKDEEDRVFGPDPEYYYAGDPETQDGGFGCYTPALVESIEGYLPDEYSVIDLSLADLGALTDTFLANNIPVIVWMTVDMERPDYRVHWYDLEDVGEDNPREINYPANLHVLVLCGYDGENFIFADPYETRGIVKHSVEDTVRIYHAMGERAIAIVKNA